MLIDYSNHERLGSLLNRLADTEDDNDRDKLLSIIAAIVDYGGPLYKKFIYNDSLYTLRRSCFGTCWPEGKHWELEQNKLSI